MAEEQPNETDAVVDNDESPSEKQNDATEQQNNPQTDESDTPTTATVVVVEDKSQNNTNSASIDHDNIDKNNKLEADHTDNKPVINNAADDESDDIVRNKADDLQSPSKSQVIINNPDGFGDNFNWDMHKENQTLKEENKRIVEKLKVKEKEIYNLEEALTTLHEELKFLESQEVQSVAKDLAKKNRKLTVQLERERTRASVIHIESQKLKAELTKYSHHNLSPKKVVQPLSFSERPAEFGLNEEQIQQKSESQTEEQDTENEKDKDKDEVKILTQKLLNAKNENMKYKDIIKKLKIALKKEIGDNKMDLSLNKINEMIRDDGNWKGRAEKIAILTNKLNETKRELDLFNDIGKTNDVRKSKNELYKERISQVSVERIKQYENAQIEIVRLEGIIDELRNDLKAKKGRIAGLEHNVTTTRTKLQFFVEKSKNDDQFIETLQSQLNQKLKLQNSLSKKEKLLTKNNDEITTLTSTINKQNMTVNVLNQTIDEMKEKIVTLTQERTEKIKGMFEKFDHDDKLYQIQLLKAENEKQKDIIMAYKKNLVNLQKRLSRKASPRNQESNNKSKSTNNSKKMSQLREKMEAMRREQELTKASYVSIIQGKEQEIEICRNLLKEQTNIHQNTVNDLQKQMKEMKRHILKK